MGQCSILLVEDDDGFADPLRWGLEREGFAVSRVASGERALAAERHDLVLLDVNLPDLDGYAVCSELRARSDVAIIMLTARGEETERVLGLELGADDYVVKPFGFRELIARIHAVTRRRSAAPTAAQVGVGGLEIDRRTRRVKVEGAEVHLRPKEFDLLTLLASEPGVVFSREQILDRVWDPHWYGPTKTIDAHVALLRKKLGGVVRIEAVRGVGFRLVEGA